MSDAPKMIIYYADYVPLVLNVAAVYLCKRTMQNKQRLELADYEAENLARLQKMFSRKWEFIFMQAEAQAKYVVYFVYLRTNI